MSMSWLPPTSQRVKISTDPGINKAIFNRTGSNIIKLTTSTDAKIKHRISELDQEWDTERVLEANFAIVSIICTILGYKVNKKFFLLGGIASVFLLQHALQGWCPPLSIIRRLGVRTAEEINYEKQVIRDLCTDN